MYTLYEVLNQRLNNRNISFANRTATLAAGNVIMFRLRVTEIAADASMTVSMDVTFPGGRVKHFDLPVNALGSYQRGGWAGAERGGSISASGTVTVNGRITFDAYVVAYEQGEDIGEWV